MTQYAPKTDKRHKLNNLKISASLRKNRYKYQTNQTNHHPLPPTHIIVTLLKTKGNAPLPNLCNIIIWHLSKVHFSFIAVQLTPFSCTCFILPPPLFPSGNHCSAISLLVHFVNLHLNLSLVAISVALGKSLQLYLVQFFQLWIMKIISALQDYC